MAHKYTRTIKSNQLKEANRVNRLLRDEIAEQTQLCESMKTSRMRCDNILYELIPEFNKHGIGVIRTVTTHEGHFAEFIKNGIVIRLSYEQIVEYGVSRIPQMFAVLFPPKQ